MLPVIKLGDNYITRLIVGGNPFSGNSHLTPEISGEMADYFTVDNIKRTLDRCAECGINTTQLRADKHIIRLLREYRNDGGQLQWIAQTASEFQPYDGHLRQIVNNGAIAVYHHGTLTDSLFKSGEYGELKKRVEMIRSTGLPVGLGTHMPEVIEYSEEHNWDVDFYMASVYNISKIDRVSMEITGRMNSEEPFEDNDRSLMYRTIRSTPKTCLAFKILGAGRKCGSYESVKAAFKEAFDNIKPKDAVVVGMFPKYKDQVSENAQIVSELLT